ncbi:MAG: hypothetical protein LBN98_03525 [Prevotellaceae bacterium]|jgi:hypothetical protein|nr:hypothetical protein [Prevotellaceae bacterium]
MGTIKTYFDNYPGADNLYETSDGQVFLEKAKAETHAQRLKEGRIITHVRGKEDATDDTEAAKEAAYATAKKTLRGLDFTADEKTFEQPGLLKLAKTLGVVTPDNKKATLIAALSELQAAEGNGQ